METKRRLGVKKLMGLADGGYYESTQLKQCEDEDITVYVPVPDTSAGIREERALQSCGVSEKSTGGS